MSEENITPESQQESAQESSSDSSTPTLDLDSTIKVDGKEISVKELLSTRDEVSQLKEYNDNAKLLISPSEGDLESREKAVRYLMTKEGYSSEDIEEYISWTNESVEEVQQAHYQESNQYQELPQELPQETSQYDPAMVQYYEEQARMQEQEKQRLSEVEDRQSRISSELMKKEMDSALTQVFSSDENIKKLLDIREGESSSNREEILQKEVESAMIEGLRNRRQAGENFNKTWFAEEAGKATKLVYDKFRSVIGDPDKIQRSPETATDSDSLFNKPPVDPPKFEKGDNMGDINVKTREWTLDHLLRGANESAAGGKSKA